LKRINTSCAGRRSRKRRRRRRRRRRRGRVKEK